MKALVVIDVQREYITPGRGFHIAGIDHSLKNAKRMLDHARAQGWPIMHVQHLQDGELFNRTSEFSHFVEGFHQLEGEDVAAKSKFSAFSSPAFAKFAQDHADDEFLVIGYGTTMCCLSTIIEGFHRGHQFTLVEDACAARAAQAFSEESMHEHAVAILSTFARISCTDDEISPPVAVA